MKLPIQPAVIVCSLLILALTGATPVPHHTNKALPTTARIKIYIATGDDDLRGGSWANLYVNNEKIENFTDKQNLQNNTSQDWTVDCPNFDPKNIVTVKLEHVSHEDFPQTHDNWNVNEVKVSFLNERGRWEEIAKGGQHRFTEQDETFALTLE